MEQQSCMRDFVHYTFLSVLGTLGVSCYILADTFFVSKGLGTNGLTALNLAIPVYNFIHGTGLMLGMGGATRFSVCKSQERTEEVNRVYTNTIYLALFFSGVFVVLGFFFSRQMAILLGADTSVLEMTTTYLRWLLLFAPAFVLNDILLCFVRNDGSPSIEKALSAHILSILRGLVLIIPMAFLLSALWEMTGVWLTYPITEFLVALLGFVIYKHKNKQKGTANYEN